MPPRREAPSETMLFRVGCGISSSSIPSSPTSVTPIPSLHSSTNTVEAEFVSPTNLETRKRKWNAPIWKEYNTYDGELFEDGVPRATCKYCKGGPIKAPSKIGTSNFIRHHEICEFVTAQESADVVNVVVHRKFDKYMYKEMVALAIIRHGYPFLFTEHEANRNLHRFLHDGFKPISRNTAKNQVMKIHGREKDKLRKFLHKVSGKICLTSDMWTSAVEQGYISLTAHFIDNDWNLHANILDFCHVEPPHTAVKLHDRLMGLLNNWEIQSKVFSITLDNCRSNDNMQAMLTQSLSMHNSLPSGGDYFHVRCSAHILNLIVQEGLKVIDGAVTKVRKLVVWTVGSERRKLKFKETALYVGIDCSRNLCLDCPTRWNSTYKMLDRAMIYRAAFERSLDRSDPSFPPVPLNEEWCRIEKICDLLSPFDELTTLMSGRHYPTANLYLTNVWNIELLLMKYASSEDEFLKNMALKMKVKFDKYWDSYSMILSFAAMLDPRYKFQLVLYCFKELDVETALVKANHVKAKFYKLFDEYVMVSGAQRGSMSKAQDQRRNVLKGFAYFDDIAQDKSELDMYLDACTLRHTQDLDVLSWWKDNTVNYPIVSQMARDILAIPITTVASESAFSIGSRVLTKWRPSLDTDTADALISTRSWLFGYDLQDDAENQEIHGLEIQISTDQDNNEDEDLED